MVWSSLAKSSKRRETIGLVVGEDDYTHDACDNEMAQSVFKDEGDTCSYSLMEKLVVCLNSCISS